MEYNSTYVRYERRGDTVVPVRVTRSWVSQEARGDAKPVRKFVVTRVSELSWKRMPRDRAGESWVSSSRVDSRARLMGLPVKHELCEEHGGLPVLEAPLSERLPYLPLGDRSTWTAAQAGQPMDAEPESREWFMRRQWAESRGYDEPDLEAA